MLSLGGVELDMLPNESNYRRTFIQLGPQRRSIYYNLISSHPGTIVRWDLKFFLRTEPSDLIQAYKEASAITFVDQDGISYQVKILSFTHDGYFVPYLSETGVTIETVSPVTIS